MIPPSTANILAQAIVEVVGHEAPHILHYGWHKGVEAYSELKERRRAQQEQREQEIQATGEALIDKLTKKHMDEIMRDIHEATKSLRG